MFAFTIIGFIIESGKYVDFQMDVFADSPMEAKEKAQHQDRRAVISNVSRKPNGWGDGY